jgi:hypothetical protein
LNLNNIFNKSKFNQYAAYLKSTGISSVSIKRKLSSLATFEKFLLKKKLISPSRIIFSPKENFLKKIFSSSVTKYQAVNSKFKFYSTVSGFAIVILGLGFGLYNQAFLQAKQKLAFSTAASPIVPTRQFSFQGRLTDSSGSPITSSTQIEFKLYDIGTTGTGTLLYDSFTDYGGGIGSTAVTPDSNGIFSVIIGKTHGSEIPATVFSQNKAVWLEITAGGEVLNPRQQIATVAYALNSETLQGLPPSASGLKNTVLVLDSTGNLNLGETSPTIKSTSGILGIEGQSLLMKASDGSGGNIEINPDANGIIKLTTEGIGPSGASGFISATNANLTTGDLFSGEINNTNRGYNFLEFKNFDIGSSSLQTRFSVSAYGNVNVGGTLNSSNISIGNTAVSSSANELNLLHGLASTNGSILYTNGSNIANLGTGTSGYLLQTNGANQAPTWFDPSTLNFVNNTANSTLIRSGSGPFTLALNLGSTNTWTAPQYFNSFVGIGTTNPAKKLDVVGDIKLTGSLFVGTGTTGASGQVLSSDGAGSLSWISAGANYTAGNGLTLAGTKFKLGGEITADTRLNIGSTELIFINSSNGFLGIGTTNPKGVLEVRKDTDINFLVGNGVYDSSAVKLSALNDNGDANVPMEIRASKYNLSDGNVGIGTTNPLYSLDVVGNGNFSSSLNIATNFSIGNTIVVTSTKKFRADTGLLSSVSYGSSNDINTGLYFPDTANLGIATSGVEAVRINQNGYVGIGTSNPSTSFHIVTTNPPGMILERANGGNASMQFKNSDDPVGYFIGMSDTEKFGIGKTGMLNNNNFVTIDSNGNFGINTTNPLYKLDVNGNANIGTTLNTNTLSANNLNVGSSLTIDSTGNISAQKFSDIANSSYFLNPANSDPNKNSLSLYETGSIKFNVGTSEFLVNGSASRIQNFSNGLLLGVSPSGSAGNAITGWDNNLFIGSTGFIGIGTTNPTKKLDVAGDLKLSGTVFVGTGTTGAIGQVLSSNGSGGLSWVTAAGLTYTAGNGLTLTGTNFKLGGNVAADVRLSIGSTEALFIDSGTGNVGIGTTSVISGIKLAVSGGGILLDNNQSLRSRDSVGTARNMLFWDSNEIVHLRNNDNATGGAIVFESKPTAGETMRLTTDGFVGIGTTNPSSFLHVVANNIPGIILERSSGTNSVMQFKNTDDPIGYFIGMSSAEKFGIGKTGDLTSSLNFVTIDSTGNVGIGTTNPISPISLAQALGNKIDLWQNGTTRYGFGIQSNLLQTYVATSTNDFAWGTGNSTSFSELMRLTGDGKLGVGTSTPFGILNLSSTSTAADRFAYFDNYSNSANGAGLVFRKSRGTVSSPSGVLTNDLLVNIGGRGFGASAFASSSRGQILFASAENWSDTAQGTNIRFLTTQIGTTATVEAMRIDDMGQIGIGTTAPGYLLDVNGNANIGSTLNTPTLTTSNISIGGTIVVSSAQRFRSHPGTLAAVSFSSNNDPNTGFYFPVSDNVGIATSGVEAIRINEIGQVGIGNTNPAYRLDVTGNVNVSNNLNAASIQIGSTDVITTGRKFRASTGTVTNNSFSLSTDTTTGMYFPSNGNLGIAVSGMDAIKIGFSGANVNVGIGTSSNPLYVLDVVGAGGTLARFTNTSGQSCVFNGGLISCSSDIRLKKNVENITYGLSDLMTLRPVDFNWKSDNDGSSKSLGFIAQEVEPLMPELVSEDPGTGYKQLNSLGLIPILTKSIQEQQQEIYNLRSKIDDLSVTQEGQIFINDNISDQVLASLGYNGAKNEIENAKYSLTDSEGNLVNKISQFNKIVSAKIETGFLAAKNLVAKNIAVENLFAKKSTIDDLKTNIISPLADNPTNTININGNASISGQLTANKVILSNSEGSSAAALQINGSASISGTLYADNIISKQGSFADLMSNKISSLRDELKKIVDSNLATGTSTPSIDQNLADQSKTWSTDIASDSAKITGDLALTDSLIIGAKLTVIGDTQLGNAFINGTFTAGEIAIKNNIIETTDTALYIQPSGTGSVNILNNTFIAENGNVTINGNLNLNGSLIAHSAAITSVSAATATVSGSLIANMIKTSEVQTDKINVSTDSTQLIIAQPNTPEIASTSAQFSTNATAGTITLPVGKTELVISNNKITPNSMIYLTPVGSTNNQVVYVKNKTPNSFTISIDNPLEKDIQINWWIIN